MESFPLKKIAHIENLYLDQNLLEVSEKLGRSLVYTNYISDLNDVIAIKDDNGLFHVPKALKNAQDWRLFQELEAQSDVIITGREYLRRFVFLLDRSQNVLTQFEKGEEFEGLGQWRLQHGFQSRSPDIAIVARRLDIQIPRNVLGATRNIFLFVRDDLADADEAQRLKDMGIRIIGSGKEGVDGSLMVDFLSKKMNYRTIYMVTGPSVVKILLDANVLDRLYITQVRRQISTDTSSAKKILQNGKSIRELRDFVLTQRYLQDKVVTEDGSVSSQEFLLYEKRDATLR